jgi:hypothetical protein
MAPSTVGPGPTQADRCMAPHPPLMRVVIAAVIQHIELEFCPLTQAKLLCFAFALCMAFVWIMSEFIDGRRITTA